MGDIVNSISKLYKAVEKASEVLEVAEKWSTKYINDLPNAAFAVIEKGYKEGDDKRARHLPHHNKSVKSATEDSSVDLPHLRNAFARVNQIKSVLGNESDSALRKKAANHLKVHRDLLEESKASFSKDEQELWNKCEELFIKNIRPLLD